ncbi:protein geranylgeranyltransferase type II [Malassezia cuniculi]|uniref:Geranylgeranyl transferase type-2 subunit alpha n=1 Tax=Malassezia cuniculi TaxID=948313 RepID=A0AAF0F197_9BASI|nr:protein geranylgeranyltransferase type II [Malassezia cuniculi]
MHNVRRQKPVPISEEAAAEQRALEQKQLETIQRLEGDVAARRARNDLTDDALDATTMLLACNPEFYSAWNYRREILLAILTEDNAKRLISADLELTQRFLRKHPKVYWLWNHRRWCLVTLAQRVPSAALAQWKQELGLVEAMLEIDARNFMGWNYRRWVVEQIAAFRLSELNVQSDTPFPEVLSTDIPQEAKEALLALAENELAYSMRKIEENFSNFSAWHQRTKLFGPVWDAKSYSEEQRHKEREAEYDTVRQGMYTDPSDQSIWLYHRWLVEQAPTRETLEAEIATITELSELEPDNKWCIQSLAYYKDLMNKLYDVDTKSEVDGLLARLIEVDPLRKGRYNDLRT